MAGVKKGYKQTDEHRRKRLSWVKDRSKLMEAVRKSSSKQKGIPRPKIAGVNHPNFGNKGFLSNRRWITNGIRSRRIVFNEEIPEGWLSGMLRRKQPSPSRILCGTILNSEWNELKRRYHFTCPHCYRSEPEIKLERDHVFPVSLGGLNIIENIQPLCVSCNRRKRTKIIKYRIFRMYSCKRQNERLDSIRRKRQALNLDNTFFDLLRHELGV